MAAAKGFQFDILNGHKHSISSDSSVLAPMQEVCKSCSHGAMQLLQTYKNSPMTSHVPYSVACLVRSIVDTVVHEAGGERSIQLLGWACREANVRPGNKFGDAVVVVLRECFNRKTRMSPYTMQN